MLYIVSIKEKFITAGETKVLKYSDASQESMGQLLYMLVHEAETIKNVEIQSMGIVLKTIKGKD